MNKILDKSGIEIEIGDWLMDDNDKNYTPYIITRIENGKVYGEIPVDNIYNKQINLGNVRVVQKNGRGMDSNGEYYK